MSGLGKAPSGGVTLASSLAPPHAMDAAGKDIATIDRHGRAPMTRFSDEYTPPSASSPRGMLAARLSSASCSARSTSASTSCSAASSCSREIPRATQPLFERRDRIAAAPRAEELPRRMCGAPPLVVRRVAAHPERLGDQQRRTLAATASLGREGRERVAIQHVVAVEHATPHTVRRRPVREALRRRREVMLRESCAERHLVVLDDEDGRHPPDGGEVQPFMKNARLGASVTDPGERHGVAAARAHGERDPGHHGRAVAHDADGRQDAAREVAVVAVAAARWAVGGAHVGPEHVRHRHAHLVAGAGVTDHWRDHVAHRRRVEARARARPWRPPRRCQATPWRSRPGARFA